MVNVYEKSGFQNPSIPKPAGGYSSTVKPASAPMRQGGLSQLAAKAAMQGRQPSVGNPPIPDTSRGVFQPRASEAPPPQDRSQELPGGYRPSLTPQVTPQRGGMVGALGQQRIAPQGQSRGMLAAAAEAPPRTPYTAPFVQIPGAGIADFYARGAAKPGAGAAAPHGGSYDEDSGYAERGEAYKERWKERNPESYEGVFGENEKIAQMLEAWGKTGGPVGTHQSAKSKQVYDLIAGGTDPQMAQFIADLYHDEHGLSDEELAKQISKGAGIQSEMMAGVGLGASGMAGTGFGDIYSQVLSDNEQLALQEKTAEQNLLAQLLSGEEQRKMQKEAFAAQQAADAKANPLLGTWSVEAGGDKISPKAQQTYDALIAQGYTEEEIKAMGWVDEDTKEYNIANPLPGNLIELEGWPPVPPEGSSDDFWAWAEAIKEKYGTNHETIKAWLDKRGVDYAAGEIDEYK